MSKRKPVGPCVYCGRQTTRGMADTRGVILPVCRSCELVDASPPAHDPDLSPGWRTVREGLNGPNEYKARGLDIPGLACAAGISRQAMHKRIAKARAQGPEALEFFLGTLRIAQTLRDT